MSLCSNNENLIPLPLARSHRSRFDIPIPIEIDPNVIGVDLNSLDKSLIYASVSFLKIDGKYNQRQSDPSNLYSCEYRVNMPIDPRIGHYGVWATAHLGLNIPTVEEKIVPRQTNASTPEEAWAKSLDKVIHDAVFKLGKNDLLFKNSTMGDYITIGISTAIGFGYVLMQLNEILAQNPGLAPIHFANMFYVMNFLGTTVSRLFLKNVSIAPVDGYRLTTLTPELDNLINLAIASKFHKYVDVIPH